MREHRLKKKQLYVTAMEPTPEEEEGEEQNNMNVNQTSHDRAHTRGVPNITEDEMVNQVVLNVLIYYAVPTSRKAIREE